MNSALAAAVDWSSEPKCLVYDGVATIRCIIPLFKNVFVGVLALTGVALFVMLILGGYHVLFSGGDQKKLEAAKGTLTGAIIGLVVIVAAYLIVKTVEVATGVPVTKFQLGF